MKSLVLTVLFSILASIAHADPFIPCEDDRFYDKQCEDIVSFDASEAVMISRSTQENGEILVEAFDAEGNLLGTEIQRDCRN